MLSGNHICCLSMILAVISCEKESAALEPEKIKDYYPLGIGKYVKYRLDSTVYLSLGTKKEIHAYLVQDNIDAVITDNLGRPSYKVKRSIRSNSDTTKWKGLMSYLVTCDSKRLEVVQDNQRYLQLMEPVSNGFSWQGNAFVNTGGIPEIQYLAGWKYTYENIRRPFTLNSVVYNETITVNQRADTSGKPSNKNFYFEINHSKEVYSKNIGLIFKDFLHESWQPPNASSTVGYYESNSYGIRLTIIDHNF